MRKPLCAIVFAGLVSLGFAIPPDFRPGYDVKPSAIMPMWFGANPSEWTMDYEAAIENAGEEGKYTLLLFSGMWWCPHCQALESKVLLSERFREYVGENGYYLSVLDFPYRNGGSNWCWLWDPSYRSEVAYDSLTDEEVTKEIIRRYEFQNSMSTHATHQVATNYVATISGGVTNLVPYVAAPISEYDRVGYPTIIVIDPYGNDIGRFSFSRKTFQDRPDSDAIDYVINSIENLKSGSRPKLFANPAEGGFDGGHAVQYAGWLTDEATDAIVGSLTVKAGKSYSKGKVKVSVTVDVGGRKKTISSSYQNVPGMTYTLAKGSFEASVTLGDRGMTGAIRLDGITYRMTGAIVAKPGFSGIWPLAVLPVHPEHPLAGGYGALTMKVDAKGKVKISGTLGDWTRVSASTQVIMGEGGLAAVPIRIHPYGRGKGGLGCVLWFHDGRLFNATALTDWSCNKPKKVFSAKWTPKFSSEPGFGRLVEGAELSIFSFPGTIGGKEVVISPECDSIHLKTTKKWVGMGDSHANLTYASKSGFVEGTVSASVMSRSGKLQGKKCQVRAVLLDGTTYGTVKVANEKTCSLKICDCSGCEE